MIDFTPTAKERFDDYMRRLHIALSGSRSAEAEDVEQSVHEHIEVALSGTPSPVPADRLAAVLDRLGDPERWAAEDGSWWRRALTRLRSGREDWRLAYAALGTFVLGFAFPPLFIVSFVLSRAYLEFMHDRGEPLGARRWLVYPPIALLLCLSAAAFIAGAAAPLVAWGLDEHGFGLVAERFVRGPVEMVRFQAGMVATAFGAWWVLASLTLIALLRPVRFVFVPLLDRLERRHVAVLTGIGVVVLAAGLLLLRPYLPFVY